MSLQKMPLAETILEQGSDDMRACIKRAVRVNANAAAEVISDISHERDALLYSVVEDGRSIRLPYPTMWLEWEFQLPTNPTIRDTELRRFAEDMPEGHRVMPTGTPVGVLLREVLDNSPGGRSVALLLVTLSAEGLLVATRNVVYLETDATGRLLEITTDKATSEEQFRLIQGTAYGIGVATTAVGLMNCKNVKVECAGSLKARAPKPKGRSRRNIAKLDYHTIVLPGMSGSRPGTREYADAMARHKVRGHFKTYTEEAPLLGKNVGTYWWGWQVRGSAKNGVTVTDYKLT